MVLSTNYHWSPVKFIRSTCFGCILNRKLRQFRHHFHLGRDVRLHSSDGSVLCDSQVHQDAQVQQEDGDARGHDPPCHG